MPAKQVSSEYCVAECQASLELVSLRDTCLDGAEIVVKVERLSRVGIYVCLLRIFFQGESQDVGLRSQENDSSLGLVFQSLLRMSDDAIGVVDFCDRTACRLFCICVGSFEVSVCYHVFVFLLAIDLFIEVVWLNLFGLISLLCFESFFGWFIDELAGSQW